MAGKMGGKDDDAIVDINVVPLIDISLVVLIIFMVTATRLNDLGIKVALPEAATGESAEASPLGITVTKDGALYLDGQPISEADLRAKVHTAHEADKDVVCLIAGDKDARHGDVTHVIDLVKREGVVKFSLNIDPIEASP